MRIAFMVVLSLHGLIHLLGFFKGFGIARIEQLTQAVTKTGAIFWLVATLVFLVATVLYFSHNSYWWIPAIAAVVLSQFLIITAWQDARFGTIPNVVILLVAFIGIMSWNFENTIRQSIDRLQSTLQNQPETPTIVDKQLPVIVETWLTRAGIQQPAPSTASFQQSGQMRTTKDGSWIPFTSDQYFTISSPGFVWIADVNPNGLMRFSGLDELINGEGSMLIKILRTIPLVNVNGPEIDQGAMVRFLAETVWFPWAAKEDYLTWEAVDNSSARGTLSWKGEQVSALFYFNENGDPSEIHAQRFYSEDSSTRILRPWIITIPPDSFREFSGIRIPTKGVVSWELPEGIFTWLEIEIVSANY